MIGQQARADIRNTRTKKNGYIENASVDGNTQKPKFSPRINFPESNLVIGPKNEIGLRTTQGGFQGVHRFQEGVEIVNVPARVIEEWFDAVLAQESGPLTDLSAPNTGGETDTKAALLARAEANASKANATDEYTNLPHRA